MPVSNKYWPHPFTKSDPFQPHIPKHETQLSTMEDDIRGPLRLTHSPVNVTFKYQTKVFLPSNMLLGIVILVSLIFSEEDLDFHHGYFLVNPSMIFLAIHGFVSEVSSVSMRPTLYPTSSITLSIQLKEEIASRNNVSQKATKTQTPPPGIS